MVIPIGIMKFFIFYIEKDVLETFLLCLKRKGLISYKNGKSLEKYYIFGYLLEKAGVGFWSKNTMWEFIENRIKSSVEELRLLKYKGMKYIFDGIIFEFGGDFSYDLWRFATTECFVFHPKFIWRTGEGNSIKFTILDDPLAIVIYQNLLIPNGYIQVSDLLEKFPQLNAFVINNINNYTIDVRINMNKTFLYLPKDYYLTHLEFIMWYGCRKEINKNDFEIEY